MPKTYVNIIDYALANNKLTNNQLAELYPSYTEENIFKITGVKNRFVVDKHTVCSDFAAENILQLFKKHAINPAEIDFLIYCTEIPDYIAPASSTVLHRKLNLPTHTGTFDLSFGCSGYTYGLLMAKALIESNCAKKVAFITADTPTQVIAEEDAELRFLFSDAVSLSIISTEEKGFLLNKFIQGTDGNGELSLFAENSGFKRSNHSSSLSFEKNEKLPYGQMKMNGMDVFRFSIDIVPKGIKDVLKKNRLSMEQIDLFIFHQASSVILKSLQRKLNIPDSKIFNNIEEVGNTVSASIPIALREAMNKNVIKEDMHILIIGFGIGFSWSATILKTKNV